ncbi:MAG TPA: M4 family metallopeptidase [Bacteroidia bacterium]|nr:M4 family metallopeptidase [Bacteroidia bacterium]
MKTEITKLLVLFSLIFTSGVMAQEILPGKEGMCPSFIKYNENEPAFNRGMIQLTDANGEKFTLKDVKLQQSAKDESGMTHYRYQQEFNNIPVEHACWVVHANDGKIKSQNGKLIKSFPSGLVTKASIKHKEALQKALDYFGAKQYKWEVPEEEEFLRREQNDISATFYPNASLVYYSGEAEVNPAALRLAYKFDIYAQEPLGRKYVFVDASDGKILGEREMIHETNANGTAITAYSGSQNIRTDYTGTNYRLRETARGTGNGIINTYNLQQGANYAGAVDFTDADNTWNNVNANKDEYATDAHWATEMTYDYYLIRHLRNSIDNAGFPLNSYVHYSVGYFNAFWDGFRMTYGDGNASDGYKPLTSLDVCGHEITHGVTEHTSNLVYSNESGAMNEGFSDIFGTAVEWYARPLNADWLIGGDFFAIRSMSNPNAFSQPDTYLGTNWFSGYSDNGGVHFNSGVLNYWFYLLTAGGSGTNDHGVAYSVSGIGMANAAKIAYKLNTYYLVSTSNYFDARTLGIQAAKDIFGELSNEAVQTANAWTAVGLYGQTCGSVLNLTSSSITETSAQVSWNAVPGAIYYVIQYKPASLPDWISAGTTSTATTRLIDDLSPATLYDWRVTGSCSGAYSQAQFTTLAPACYPPANLGATIAGTTVTLEWTPYIYDISFHLQYKAATDNTWIDEGWITALTHTLSGLNNNTLYDWKVETDCGFDISETATSTFTTDAPACGTVSGLTVSYSAGLTTTFNWNEVPGAYRYRFQMKWSGYPWDYLLLDELVTDESFVYVGFGSGFEFDWRVRAECADNLGAYVESTVSTPCPAPSELTIPTITSYSATLNWVASGANSIEGYNVHYKLASSGTWINAGATGVTSFTLGSLAAATLYDVRVQQSCMSYNSSYIQSQFTTLLCGNIPAASFTDIKTTSGKITWNAVGGILSYTLQYKKSTVGTWTTVTGITNNFYSLTGLTAATTYNYQVKAVCAAGSGAFSPLASFTTYCISSGQNNQEYIDYFSLGLINRTSGVDAGGYIHTGLTTNLLIGSTGNAGMISAGFSGPTKTEIFAVYIDLNRNGVYTDAGERVVGPTTFTTSGNVSFTMTVPGTASSGITSMRVVMLRTGTTMAPCLTGNRGETEDYFVLLTTTGGAFSSNSNNAEETTLNVAASGLSYHVSPNPSDGIFRIKSNSSNAAGYYEIMNISGYLIAKKYVSGNEEIVIDISNEAAGIYILRLSDLQENKQVLKLVKK